MLTRHWLNKLSIILLALFFQSCREQKTGFVDIYKLVSEFELQKEYTERARKEYDRARTAIDSVVFVAQLKHPETAEAIKNELYGDLSRKTEAYNKDIEQMIWTRLNPYISDFGKEHGYDYIYGANGTGNVLYAAESRDITVEVIQYVNDRYHDKK